jgi:hypothetical protein
MSLFQTNSEPIVPRRLAVSRRRAPFRLRAVSHACVARPNARRAGLAPLELVLCLPLLLFIMALIMNFATAAAWKVRSLTVARQVVWRQRYPRNGATDPRMPEWPSRASMSVTGAQPNVFQGDPFGQHLAVRGPTIAEPSQGRSFMVNPDLLDINFDLEQGNSDIRVNYPLLPQMASPRFQMEHQLLDSQWRYAEMGLGRNFSHRLIPLYSYRYGQDVQQLSEQYVAAAMAILNNPSRRALMPLDQDDEFYAYTGSAPDFYRLVHLIRGCTLDVANIQMSEVQQAVRSIQGPSGGGRNGLPDTMASRFISLYRARIQYLQSLMPPPQAEIDQLQTKIDELTRFRNSLN